VTTPPPQAALIAAALFWNYARSRNDRRTISQYARHHKKVAVPALIVGAAWLVPHWWHD
jgi:hypothetical protein